MASSPLDDPWKVIATPATLYNREVGFAVKVSTAEGCIGRIPILGELYSAAKFEPKIRVGEFGSYVCTGVEGSGAFLWAYYSLAKTALQANTAYKSPHKDLQNHYWPRILLRVDMVKNRVPRTSNIGDFIVSGTSYSAVPIFHESADSGTLFVLHEFLSNDEPVAQQHMLPQPTPINFAVPGGPAFSFADSLHDDISIAALDNTSRTYASIGGSVTSAVGVLGPYFFPRTNMKTWLAHFLYERSSKIATGAWKRDLMEVIPPPLPKVTRG